MTRKSNNGDSSKWGLHLPGNRRPLPTMLGQELRIMSVMHQWISKWWLRREWNDMNISAQLTEWINYWINEEVSWSVDESMIQWINDPVNHCIDQWIDDSVNYWMSELLCRWINESVNKWRSESTDGYGSMNQWTDASTNRWFSESMNSELVDDG